MTNREGLEAELSNSKYCQHAFVTDDLTLSFLVVVDDPYFETEDEIVACALVKMTEGTRTIFRR